MISEMLMQNNKKNMMHSNGNIGNLPLINYWPWPCVWQRCLITTLSSCLPLVKKIYVLIALKIQLRTTIIRYIKIHCTWKNQLVLINKNCFDSGKIMNINLKSKISKLFIHFTTICILYVLYWSKNSALYWSKILYYLYLTLDPAFLT